MKMTITFTIGPDGQGKADVEGGRGPVCVTEVLEPLERLLGKAGRTNYKPEYELDHDAIRLIQQLEA